MAKKLNLPNRRDSLLFREVEFIPNNTDRQSAHLQTGTAGEVNERLVFTDIVQLPVL